MSGAVSPLKDNPHFVNLLTKFENPFMGIIVGIAFTAVLQSASASVGILQALSVTGSISFAAALPITMGIGVGAACPVLLSSIGTNKNGKRTALIYLLNDLFGMIFWSIVFYSVNAFVHFKFLNMTMSPIKIAMMNSIFRLATIMILLPCINLIEKLVFRLIKDDPEDLEEQAQAKAQSAPAETAEGYSGQLRDIRGANDRIADPVISAKIDRLEELAGKIFRIVEEEPEKKAKASTFLNYYLPTTQKLLDSYADFEEAGVSGENVSQAKQRIADTMDKIVEGFERQLDQLYQSDAMDVDSDIRVMEQMLRRDGAGAADDFGMGAAVQQEQTE